MASVRVTSICGSAASAISIRKGISLAASPAVMASPAGSLTINRSGGRSQPVSSGEISRATNPDGAARKTRPNAAAACGTASSGDTRCTTREKSRVPAQPATKRNTTATDSAVAASPVPSASIAPVASPGSAASWRNGSSDSVRPPSAGR